MSGSFPPSQAYSSPCGNRRLESLQRLFTFSLLVLDPPHPNAVHLGNSAVPVCVSFWSFGIYH